VEQAELLTERGVCSFDGNEKATERSRATGIETEKWKTTNAWGRTERAGEAEELRLGKAGGCGPRFLNEFRKLPEPENRGS
jgi:hypothetical protein